MYRKLIAITLIIFMFAPVGSLFGETTTTSSRDLAPKELRTWVDARAGTGTPVHWIAEGSVFAYPSGKKLFGLIGFDSSRVIWPDDPDGEIIHLTRKTFAYTDPETGKILKEFNGQPVEPIAYPYQLIRYRMENGIIFGDVEQGTAPNIQEVKSRDGLRVRWIGTDTLAVTAPVFIDVPLSGDGRLEAWENYDFFLHSGEDVEEPHQMSWQRYGDLPAWAGKGKAIYHLLSWRVESHNEFPPELLTWAKANKPMWLNPPASLEEVRDLQQGKSGAGWSRNK